VGGGERPPGEKLPKKGVPLEKRTLGAIGRRAGEGKEGGPKSVISPGEAGFGNGHEKKS
jgi:hypothetical protein